MAGDCFAVHWRSIEKFKMKLVDFIEAAALGTVFAFAIVGIVYFAQAL